MSCQKHYGSCLGSCCGKLIFPWRSKLSCHKDAIFVRFNIVGGDYVFDPERKIPDSEFELHCIIENYRV